MYDFAEISSFLIKKSPKLSHGLCFTLTTVTCSFQLQFFLLLLNSIEEKKRSVNYFSRFKFGLTLFLLVSFRPEKFINSKSSYVLLWDIITSLL